MKLYPRVNAGTVQYFNLWKLMKWSLISIGTIALTATGISIFYTPGGEVCYSCNRIITPMGKGEKGAFWTCEIGNTGRHIQQNVRIRFSKSVMDKLGLPISVSNFGVTERRLGTSTNGTTLTVDIGELKIEQRVTMNFTIIYKKGEHVHFWDEFFLGMEISEGTVKKGNPAMTSFGRALFNFFTFWQ